MLRPEMFNHLSDSYKGIFKIDVTTSDASAFLQVRILSRLEGTQVNIWIPNNETFERATQRIMTAMAAIDPPRVEGYARQTKEYIIKQMRKAFEEAFGVKFGTEVTLTEEMQRYFFEELFNAGLRPTEPIDYSKHRLTEYSAPTPYDDAEVYSLHSNQEILDRLALLEDEIEAGQIRRIIEPKPF